jgi:hypothetical protein
MAKQWSLDFEKEWIPTLLLLLHQENLMRKAGKEEQERKLMLKDNFEAVLISCSLGRKSPNGSQMLPELSAKIAFNLLESLEEE